MKTSFKDITISRLPDGGVLVVSYAGQMSSNQLLFAASEIEEALACIQEKLTEKEPDAI